jgi:hypothetical protein
MSHQIITSLENFCWLSRSVRSPLSQPEGGPGSAERRERNIKMRKDRMCKEE